MGMAGRAHGWTRCVTQTTVAACLPLLNGQQMQAFLEPKYARSLAAWEGANAISTAGGAHHDDEHSLESFITMMLESHQCQLHACSVYCGAEMQ